MNPTKRIPILTLSASLSLMTAVGCQPAVPAVQEPAPAVAEGHQHDPAGAPPGTQGGAGAMHRMEPDVRFMHHMTMHHAQAVVMSALVPSRASAQGVKLLAERIDVSQKDEIALMRRWLEQRGKPLPPPGDHAMHMSMPGMISDADMARLAAATGPQFDRLFLELMIRHHQGALTMVAELLGSPGGAQDSELFRLVSDIDADQRAEIDRMRAMLAAMNAPPR